MSVIWLAFLLSIPVGRGFAGETKKTDSCIACHKGASEATSLQHTFLDWIRSVHGKAGVECQACHGGDPSHLDMEGAHGWMAPSTDPKSPVYFTNIPETCGACHKDELDAFKRSAHYRELQRNGHGPNCVTCHGSMANHVLAPKDLEMTCTLCHRRPTKAFAAQMALEESRVALHKLDEAVKRAGKGGGTAAARQAYKDALQLRDSAVIIWHTFEMDKVIATARESARKAAAAYDELRAGNKGGGKK